jgi:hypothetical protein
VPPPSQGNSALEQGASCLSAGAIVLQTKPFAAVTCHGHCAVRGSTASLLFPRRLAGACMCGLASGSGRRRRTLQPPPPPPSRPALALPADGSGAAGQRPCAGRRAGTPASLLGLAALGSARGWPARARCLHRAHIAAARPARERANSDREQEGRSGSKQRKPARELIHVAPGAPPTPGPRARRRRRVRDRKPQCSRTQVSASSPGLPRPDPRPISCCCRPRWAE